MRVARSQGPHGASLENLYRTRQFRDKVDPIGFFQVALEKARRNARKARESEEARGDCPHRLLKVPWPSYSGTNNYPQPQLGGSEGGFGISSGSQADPQAPGAPQLRLCIVSGSMPSHLFDPSLGSWSELQLTQV